MKTVKYLSCFGFLLIGSVFYSTQAMAFSNGFYVQLGSGSADWTTSFDNTNLPDVDNEADTSHLGIGYVFDTATTEDKLFNYRFHVGFEQFDNEFKDSSRTFEFSSLVIDQDFGFGIVRNDSIRFWLGPEVRVAYAWGTSENYDNGLFGIGLAPVVGLNIHTGEHVSLGLKGGYMIMSYGGVGLHDTNSDFDVEYSVDENYLFFNFAVLFH